MRVDDTLEIQKEVDLIKDDLISLEQKFQCLVETCQRRQDSMRESVKSLIQETTLSFNRLESQTVSRLDNSEKDLLEQFQELNGKLTDFQEETHYISCSNMNTCQRLRERFDVVQKEDKYLKFWQVSTFTLIGVFMGMLVMNIK